MDFSYIVNVIIFSPGNFLPSSLFLGNFLSNFLPNYRYKRRQSSKKALTHRRVAIFSPSPTIHKLLDALRIAPPRRIRFRRVLDYNTL